MPNAAKQDDASSSSSGGYQPSRTRSTADLMSRTDRPSLMSLQRRTLAVPSDGASANHPLLLDIGTTILPPDQRRAQNGRAVVQEAIEQVLAMLEDEDDFS